MHNFKEIKPTELKENAIKLIGNDWMLISAGDDIKYNAMTASWGGMGMLWNKPVMFIFIRPHRFTYQFVEQEEYFTCSFYDEKYRDKLNFFGTYSGRDYDKAKETGFTVVKINNSIAFNEARIVIVCRKVYQEDIQPEHFLASFILKHYPSMDYHRMYIGEIMSVWINEE
ncbi:MAG TPA: flavin reductase [Lentimicrobium sp.]|nr:flavin reductase [Lentimicrobium sp.]